MRPSNLTGRFRRVLQLVACLGVGFVVFAGNSSAEAQVQREPTLRDRLVFGLKARHPTEIDFLEQVAAQVQIGNIPADIVDETFFWVYTRKRHNPFPFIYFERILRLKGNAARIPIPAYTGPFRSG